MEDLNPKDVWELDQEIGNKKFYHHWSYDPNTDTVTIDKGKTGEDHGYAYRIDGGWRILDVDHKKVKDFYIFPKVLEALRGETEEAGEAKDYDFDHLHYGQPLEINNEVQSGDNDGIN